jgi:hypothetical protein
LISETRELSDLPLAALGILAGELTMRRLRVSDVRFERRPRIHRCSQVNAVFTDFRCARLTVPAPSGILFLVRSSEGAI